MKSLDFRMHNIYIYILFNVYLYYIYHCLTIINWSAAFGGQQQIEALQPEWEKRLAASRPKMCKLESLGRSSQSLVFEKAAGLSPKKTFKKTTQ